MSRRLNVREPRVGGPVERDAAVTKLLGKRASVSNPLEVAALGVQRLRFCLKARVSAEIRAASAWEGQIADDA